MKLRADRNQSTNETAPGSPVFRSPEGEARFLAAYDAAMQLWPVPYQTREIPTDYGSTHVIVSGPEDGPPLLLLHCALMTSAIWSPIIGQLSERFRTYAVDVIGDVGRTVPTRPPSSEAEFADWLVQVQDRLGLTKSLVLAWSFGGWVATNFAMHHPERVERLALLAPFKPFAKQSMGFLKGFVPWVIRSPRTARWFERKMCFKEDFGYPEHSALLYERFRSGKLMLKVAPRTFSDLEFRHLTMPTLLLVGEQEMLYDGSAAVERASRVLPDGEAVLLADCNHAVVSDQTEEVTRRVLGFLG